MCVKVTKVSQGHLKWRLAAPAIFIWVAIVQGLGPGQSPGIGSGGQIQKLKQSADSVFTDFDYRNDQYLRISHNSNPKS